MPDNDLQIENQLQNEAVRQDLAVQEKFEEEAQAQEFEEEALLAAEEDEANQLAAAQEAYSIQRQSQELYDRGMAFTGPSASKWGILFTLAVVNDVIDLLALTGVLEILSWLISLGLTASILIIMWLMDSDMKKAHAYAASVKDIAQQTQISTQTRQIEGEIRGLAKGISERLKKVPGFSKIGVRETPRKNPLARALTGSAVESIPYIGAINLITVWVFFAYLAEREAHKSARKAAEEARGQMLTSAAEMV